MYVEFLPRGPSSVSARSEAPIVALVFSLSWFPSICLNSKTELNELYLAAGKALE